jgi:esterase/lipase
MKSLADCKILEKGNKIYREEENKSICFENKNYELVCEVVPIENCVLTKADDGKRCDFLFLFDNQKQEYKLLKDKKSLAYYVELKGIELDKACEQLLNSIDKTKDQINNFELNAMVVSSREFNPKYDNNEFYRNVKRLIKKDIQFKVSPHTITI